MKKGFTLIELIIAVVILGIIAAGTGPLLGAAASAIGLTVDRMNLDESAAVAFSRMTREIRRLRDDASVVSAGVNQYEFVDSTGVSIRYRLVGNTLMRRQGANAEVGLADFIQTNALSFIYFDDDGNTIASPAAGLGTNTNIRRIQIQITFQDGNHILPVEVQIRPRNLRHENERFF